MPCKADISMAISATQMVKFVSSNARVGIWGVRIVPVFWMFKDLLQQLLCKFFPLWAIIGPPPLLLGCYQTGDGQWVGWRFVVAPEEGPGR